MKLVSTKILSADIIHQLNQWNWEVDCIPTIRLEPFNFNLPDQIETDAVIFTSPMAVKSFFLKSDSERRLEGRLIYSTNGSTKDALLTNNQIPYFVGRDANEIGNAIIRESRVSSVLHICGNKVLPLLGKKMKTAGKEYQALVVYQNICEFIDLIPTSYDSVFLFSPSGVDGFIKNNPIRPEVVYVCIGQTTANHLKKISNPTNILISRLHSVMGMAEELHQYYLLTK